MNDVKPGEADQALALIEQQRTNIIGEVDAPRWYWWCLAIAWIGLGTIVDLKRPVLTASSVVAFLVASTFVSRSVSPGRRRSRRISVRLDVIGRQGAITVIAALVAMIAATIGGALLAEADGARHPVTTASVPVAVAIVLGGRAMLALVRARARRHSEAT
jgi:hypothetical protein